MHTTSPTMPQKLSVDSVVQRDPDVVSAEAGQELVMVSVANGLYYGISDVALEVWKAIEQLGADRVCYGSDTPFDIMHVCVAKYKALIEDLPVEDQAKIMGGNLLKALGF